MQMQAVNMERANERVRAVNTEEKRKDMIAAAASGCRVLADFHDARSQTHFESLPIAKRGHEAERRRSVGVWQKERNRKENR